MKSQIVTQGQPILLDPLALFVEQLKNKTIKKQSIENIHTIALMLTPAQVREQLAPLMIKTFVQESMQIRVTIIKAFPRLLQFIGGDAGACVILEFIIDVLCVFNEEQIRNEAHNTLTQLMEFVDASSMKDQLLKVIGQLQKENEINMLEVNLRLLLYVFPILEENDQEFLLEILSQYQQKADNLTTIAEQLPQFIKKIPSFPQEHVHSMITSILESTNNKAKTKLPPAITLLTYHSHQSNTLNIYILTLLKDENSQVVASVILYIKEIVLRFDKLVLSQIWTVVDSFESRDTTVKTAIIEVLEYIPLTQQRKKMIISTNNPNKSLNLSKTLATSLCKIHDFQSLETIINNSDTQFKNKLFPKLPATCQIHIKLMEQLLGQKNWRNKLTLLANIEKRLENEEKVEILLPKLLEQLGDKIAVVRIGVIKLIYKILRQKKISLLDVKDDLNSSLGNRNWFQRQSVIILLQEISNHYSELSRLQQQLLKDMVKRGAADSVQGIRQLANSITNKYQKKKLIV